MRLISTFFLLLAASPAFCMIPGACPGLVLGFAPVRVDARAVVASPLVDGEEPKLPTVAWAGENLLVLRDRELEQVSESGVLAAPASRIRIKPEHRKALGEARSLAMARSEGAFPILFHIGRTPSGKSLHALYPPDADVPFYSAVPLAYPLWEEKEFPTTVRTWADDSTYLFVRTNFGRLYRATVHDRPHGKAPSLVDWRRVLNEVPPTFVPLDAMTFLLTDDQGSVFYASKEKRDWLGKLPGPVESLAAYMRPHFGGLKYREDRITVWATILNTETKTLELHHWISAPGNRPIKHTPFSFAPHEEPLVASATLEDGQERVAVVSLHSFDGALPSYSLHVRRDNDWMRPQWWRKRPAPAPSPTPASQQTLGAPLGQSTDHLRFETVRPNLVKFLRASGIYDEAILGVIKRSLCRAPQSPEGHSELWISDLGLTSQVLGKRAGDVVDLVQSFDVLFGDLPKTPLKGRVADAPFDARRRIYPVDQVALVAQMAVHTMAREFAQEPENTVETFIDVLAAMPAYAELPFWEFLEKAYDKLEAERQFRND